MPRLLVSLLLIVCSASLAWAQSTNPDPYPKVEVFVGYSVLGVLGEGNKSEINFGSFKINAGFNTETGFEASVIGNLNKYLGLKGDFSAYFNHHDDGLAVFSQSPSVTQNFEIRTKLFNFLVGPEIKARNRTRLTPWAHALFGVAHERAAFETAGSTLTLSTQVTHTGFAMALGGGLDIRATNRFSLRALMDYNPVFVGKLSSGPNDRRDHVRISLGILFH